MKNEWWCGLGDVLQRFGGIMKHVNVLRECDDYLEIRKNVFRVVSGNFEEAFDSYWNVREIVKVYMKNEKIDKRSYYRFVNNLTYVFKSRFGVHPSKVRLDKLVEVDKNG